MSIQFVPVPYEALDVATRPEDIALVVRLYETAHSRRWRPFTRSTRDLADASGCPRSRVHRLLSRLEEAGLVSREIRKVGGRSEGMRLTVYDPQKVVGHDAGHDAGHGRDTARDTGPEDEGEESDTGGTRRGTRTGHDAGHGAGHPPSSDPDPDPDPDPSTLIHTQGGAPPALVSAPWPPAAWVEAWTRYAEASGAPRHSWARGSRLGKALQSALKAHSLDDLLLVMRWHAEAHDEGTNGGATFHRQRQSDGLTIIGRAGPLEARIDRARSWLQSGGNRQHDLEQGRWHYDGPTVVTGDDVADLF